jgi:hypothetical protein
MLTVQTYNNLSEQWETQWLDVPRKASGEEIIEALNQATEIPPGDPDDSAKFVDEDQVGNVRVLKAVLTEYWNEPWYVVCTGAQDPEAILLKSKFGTEYQQSADNQREAQMPADDFAESRSREDRGELYKMLLSYMQNDPELIAHELAYTFMNEDQVQEILDVMLGIEEEMLMDMPDINEP